ncbi:MAG TPA: NDP-sugar synthase [Candidatus Kryptonia bacterium]|nr:NDP-sugar synthase [Candidatus Kryptonia bacterium]
MKAAIIAAGQGERLQRAGVPKPLVKVAGVPLIDHTLNAIRAAGLHQVACIINQQSAAVAEHCAAITDLSLTFVHRTTPSSMESLFTLAPYLLDDAFLLLTVDAIVAPFAVRDFVRAAQMRSDAAGVLAVSTFIDDEKPLRVTCGVDGRVTAIGESAGDSPSITAGFYVFRPTIFAEIAAARAARFTALRQFLAHLVARGYRLFGERVPKSVDVDRPEDVATAEAFIRSGYTA